MLNKLKKRLLSDSVISKAVTVFMNYELKDIGTVESLEIDFSSRRINMDLNLEGEKESVHISLEEYGFEESLGSIFFVVQRAYASRKWMEKFIRKYICGKKIEIPEKVGRVLKATGKLDID